VPIDPKGWRREQVHGRRHGPAQLPAPASQIPDRSGILAIRRTQAGWLAGGFIDVPIDANPARASMRTTT
jgi:hypothetical protein